MSGTAKSKENVLKSRQLLGNTLDLAHVMLAKDNSYVKSAVPLNCKATQLIKPHENTP